MASYAFFANHLPSSPIVSTKKNKQRHQGQVQPQQEGLHPRWRLREAAQALWEERTVPKEGQLCVSADFDVSVETLQEHVNERVTGRAFTLAARCVLHALRTSSDKDHDETLQDPYECIPHLPAALAMRQAVRRARAAALQRSLDNKAWAKRKAKPAASTSASSAADKRSKGGKNGKGKNNKTASPSSSGGGSAKDKKRKAASGDASDAATTETAPKFTRNTPASSAAALDQRFTNSRAILCAAGNIVLSGKSTDPADIPQKDRIANLGAVVVDATVYGRRTLYLTENAVRRANWRYQFRQAHYKAQRAQLLHEANNDTPLATLQIPNLFMGSRQRDWLDDMGETWEFQPHLTALTDAWESKGRAALAQILETGGRAAGNALYYDTEWNSRHGRLCDFLRSQATSLDTLDEESTSSSLGWGPHLIVTTRPEVELFCQEFHDWRSYLSNGRHQATPPMRACKYVGSASDRRQLRKMWPRATGLPEDPLHVVVMSYATFLEDYLHVCQLPWGTVILDDGACWLAASQGDPNSSLAALWDQAVWSNNDHFTGLAGTTLSNWDFDLENWKENFSADTAPNAIKDAYIGLTSRYRILTASRLSVEQKQAVDLFPISGLINFVAPHFAAVVREEWDRNNIAKDGASMEHFRQLVARYMVVHHSDATEHEMKDLAVKALQGRLPLQDDGPEALAPVEVSEDDFVSDEKVTFSRRACLGWLGRDKSCLRYELGRADFQPILEVMKLSTKHGHYCEEVTTASSMTTSGATGQVSGSMAYRLAVRCGRHFGSEQGLRQHVSAQHAPPGTWLCRTCGSDCITSQARTHHERACGQPSGSGVSDTSGTAGAIPTVGQGGVKSGVGKKKSQRSSLGQNGNTLADVKDPDGSFRVPGYIGVWVTKEGKHFIKVDGKRCKEGESEVLLFDTIDDAAKKYDEVVSETKKGDNLELNFKPDGSRNVYDDSTSTTASGVGGSAANVVPLLSIINIKDLPPDVKPLLRDPRQTSRTGGNSKRHVYAYRGVCRQARKGHDRWQSQISFMGVNHYLGTFDSEWDAAAIYAWAHLILYGEEATRQAQKEGEEAAAAYEQEKRDIASGKIPAPPPKSERKKTVKTKEPKEKASATAKKKKDSPAVEKREKKEASSSDREKVDAVKSNGDSSKKRKQTRGETAPAEKKARTDNKPSSKVERDMLAAVVSKGVSKASILGHRELFESLTDADLLTMVSTRLEILRENPFCLSHPNNLPPAAIEPLRSCLTPQHSKGISPLGAAVLVGIPANIGWSFPDFIYENRIQEDVSVVQILAVEYDNDGMNEKFQSVVQGSVCIIGQASKKMMRQYQEVGGGSVEMGCGVGSLDCHIGGVPGTCSPRAACIRYDGDVFRITCLNDKDVVTLNGERLRSGGEGSVLYNYDVCSVGPRVFAFVLPTLNK